MVYKSQYRQDAFLDTNVFRGKRNGVFIDIGAYDGVDISNTYHFETALGWTGLCVEPSPQTFELLKKNRKCKLENCAVSDTEGNLDFVNITGWASSASGFNDPQGKVLKTAIESVAAYGGTYDIIQMPTFRLDTLLNKHKIRFADYCSIDVEGFEINVVRSIDWNKYYIQYLTVENNVSIGQVVEHLKQFKYSVLQEGPDLIFKLNR